MNDGREKAATVSRRSFIQMAGRGAGVAGAMAFGAGGSNEASAAAPEAAKVGGYRETEHIRTYYQHLRF